MNFGISTFIFPNTTLVQGTKYALSLKRHDIQEMGAGIYWKRSSTKDLDFLNIYECGSFWNFNHINSNLTQGNNLLDFGFEICSYCDDLTLIDNHPLNQTINMGSQAFFTINSPESTASYQWQTDIGFGFQNISNAGQYNGVFSNTLTLSNTTLNNNNQHFRCIVSKFTCKDTSNIAVLTIIDNTSIEKIDNSYLEIYPNPTTSILNISINAAYVGSAFYIINQLGQVIKKGILNKTLTHIEIDDLEKGIYFLHFSHDMLGKHKIIKN